MFYTISFEHENRTVQHVKSIQTFLHLKFNHPPDPSKMFSQPEEHFLAIYSCRSKNMPALPKCREEVHKAFRCED